MAEPDLALDLPHLSLFQILQRRQRERLLVTPLHWTSSHLHLLRCSFVDLSPPPPSRLVVVVDPTPRTALQHRLASPPHEKRARFISRPNEIIPPPAPVDLPDTHVRADATTDTNANRTVSNLSGSQTSSWTRPPTPTVQAPSSQCHRWARILATNRVVAVKQCVLTNLLLKSSVTTPWEKSSSVKPVPSSLPCVSMLPPRWLVSVLASANLSSSEPLVFCFGQHQEPLLPCLVFSAPITAVAFETHSAPSVAFVDASDILNARKKSLQYIYKPRFSQAAWSTYTTRLARVTPPSTSHDPYIAALLIAMAQSQRSRACDRVRSFQVHVLQSKIGDKSQLHVYSTCIPDAFLDKIARPRQPPSSNAAIRIHAIAVPYEPYESFQQRLLHVLLPRGRKRARESDGDEDVAVRSSC